MLNISSPNLFSFRNYFLFTESFNSIFLTAKKKNIHFEWYYIVLVQRQQRCNITRAVSLSLSVSSSSTKWHDDDGDDYTDVYDHDGGDPTDDDDDNNFLCRWRHRNIAAASAEIGDAAAAAWNIFWHNSGG